MKRETMWGDVWAAKEILAGSQNLKCFSCRVAFSQLAPHRLLFMFVTSDNGPVPQRIVFVSLSTALK